MATPGPTIERNVEPVQNLDYQGCTQVGWTGLMSMVIERQMD